MATDKDTIYIDIDDEITGIIDKLKASDGKVVALVLPKRAGVFQSIVNMKLLKRAADGAKKNAVLITSEAGLLPLAGAAGLHVAKTLTSKPEIPVGPALPDEDVETVDESEADAGDSVINPDQTVGELAGAGAPPVDNGVETIALDDEDVPPEDAPKSGPKSKSFEPKPKKDKKLKIPNFDRFRLLLILGGLLLIILIGGFIFANSSLAKATINIKTDATNVNASQDVTLSTSATNASADGSAVPAKLAQQQKTYTEQAPTTGQKNEGNKASGQVTITNCGPSSETISAGTGFSANGSTYISQTDVTVPASNFSFGNKCKNDGNASVSVIAQNPGSSYNIPSGASFSIATSPAYTSAQGGTISGGTDNIVQSVNQNDINNAKAKINTSDTSVKQTLDSQLKAAGFFPIDATYSPGTPVAANSANVGDTASTVTVTETVTYTMFGAQKANLQSLIDDNIKSQIDTSKQSILDDGLGSAAYNIANQSASGASMTISTKAVVGPQLDTSAIKTASEGQKAGAIKSQLSNNPDVTSVNVSFSPFWVSSAPKKTSRIIINIAKPTTTKSSSSNGSNP